MSDDNFTKGKGSRASYRLFKLLLASVQFRRLTKLVPDIACKAYDVWLLLVNMKFAPGE